MSYSLKQIEIRLGLISDPQKRMEYLISTRSKIKSNSNPLMDGISPYDETILEIIEKSIEECRKELKPISLKRKKAKETRGQRVIDYSKEFISALNNQECKTDSEVIDRLKKIEPKYIPRQVHFLNADGTPIKKRIHEALANIFTIKYPNEEVDHTTVRKALKARDLELK